MYHTKNQQIWNLISSIHESVDFSENFYPYDLSIDSRDNWYRLDTFEGDNSISLTISKEYSIVESKSSYTITLMKNGQTYRQTQQELVYRVIGNEIIPKLRDTKLQHLISDI